MQQIPIHFLGIIIFEPKCYFLKGKEQFSKGTMVRYKMGVGQ